MSKLADNLGRGTDNPQHSTRGQRFALGWRKKEWEVTLLNGTQCLGRSSVAGEDDKRTTEVKQTLHGLEREFINALEAAGTIRGTGIIAQVEIIVLRQKTAYLTQNGETAVTAVKDADWGQGGSEFRVGSLE